MPDGATSWLLDVPAQEVFIDGAKVEPTVRQWELIGASATYNATTQRMEITMGGGGFDWQESVRLGTIAALPANTRTNNTLLADANGALSIDGTAAVVGDRVLIKDEGLGAHNGIYVIDAIGGAGSKWQMTRAVTADSDAELTNGLTVFIGPDGGTLDNQIWFISTPDPITVNATVITFTFGWTAGSTVSGPGASTDEGIARWDGITGTLLQDSTTTITDAGLLTIPDAGALIHGTTNPAGTGAVRLQDADSIRFWGTGPVDIGGLTKDAADSLIVGGPNTTRPAQIFIDATGDTVVQRAGTAVLTVANAFLLAAADLRFDAAFATPLITQVVETADATTAQTLTIEAQGVSGAAGTSTSGNALVRGGRGTGGAGNTDGNVALHEVPAGWLGGEEILFISDAVTPPTAAAAAGSFLWSESSVLTSNVALDLDIATAHLRLGLVAGSGAGSAASAGDIRAQGGARTQFAVRNNAESADRDIIRTLASDVTYFGSFTTGNTILWGQNNVQIGVGGSSQWQLTTAAIIIDPPIFRWDSSVLNPTLNQLADATAGVTGDMLTINAQDVSGTGATTGGALLIRPGDATGAGANTGGNFDLRPGAHGGGGGGVGGQLALQNGSGNDRVAINDTGIGFFAATPVAQPSSTGETVGFTAGTGTGVNDDSTFTGNVGATAYRISDIVKHLKNLGLLTS